MYVRFYALNKWLSIVPFRQGFLGGVEGGKWSGSLGAYRIWFIFLLCILIDTPSFYCRPHVTEFPTVKADSVTWAVKYPCRDAKTFLWLPVCCAPTALLPPSGLDQAIIPPLTLFCLTSSSQKWRTPEITQKKELQWFPGFDPVHFLQFAFIKARESLDPGRLNLGELREKKSFCFFVCLFVLFCPFFSCLNKSVP